MNKAKKNTFGNWLRDVRESAGLSLRELSEISEIDHSMLNKVEHGDRFLSDEKIIRIAQIFKNDPEALISLKNNDKQLISAEKISNKKSLFIPGFRPEIEAEVIKYLKVYRKKKKMLKLTFPLNLIDVFWEVFGLKTYYESFLGNGLWQLGDRRKLAALYVKDKIIIINTDPMNDESNLPTPEIQQFSLAHEGAHYIIQLRKENQFSNQPIFFRSRDLHNKEETDANYWSGAFLMPKPHFTERIRKLSGVRDEKNIVINLNKIGNALCKEFGVSRQALEIRLKKIGLKCKNTIYIEDARQLQLF